MSLFELAGLYVGAGLFLAFVIDRKSTPTSASARATSAALVVVLWPLWAPIALGVDTAPAPAPSTSMAVLRLQHALHDAVASAAGTPFATLLSTEAAARVVHEAARADERATEIQRLLDRGPTLKAARARVQALREEGASERGLATAELQAQNLERLEAARTADLRALTELAELADALRGQLLLLRHAGSTETGADAMVSELWARALGLSAALSDAPEGTDHPSEAVQRA